MPLSTLVQTPGLVWDQVFTFPWPRYEDTHPQTPGFPLSRFAMNVGGVQRENSYVWSYSTRTNNMTATNYALTAPTGGPSYFQINSAGIGTGIVGLDAMRCQTDIGTGFALAAGAEHSSDRRVWWLKWLMQSPTAAPDIRCGLVLTPANNGNVTRWVDNAATHGGAGFTGDGAGQWQYASYNRAGPGVVREVLALPAHVLTEWNMFELLVISERPGIPASLQVWFNGALIATRNWLAALLEPYTAQEWYMLPLMGGGGVGAAGECNFMDVEMRRGRFTRIGVEV